MAKFMRAKILNEGFDRDGNSRIAIWSNPRAVYRRADGTFYFVGNGKRYDIERRADGTFYLATRQA